MPSYNDRVMVFKSSPMGEADKLVVFFGRESGKISAIAKSARKPGSKFGGALEIFSYNNVMLGKGRTLDILSQIETIDSFQKIRRQPDKLFSGINILKLANEFLNERQKNESLFDLLLNVFFLLKETSDAKAIENIFQIKLMHLEGFFPIMNQCVKCSRQVIKKPASVKFSSPLGGILCTNCSKQHFMLKEIAYPLVELALLVRDTALNNFDLTLLEKSAQLEDIFFPYIGYHIGKDLKQLKCRILEGDAA